MDEEIEIINTNTRVEKLKNLLISKRRQLITSLILIILKIPSMSDILPSIILSSIFDTKLTLAKDNFSDDSESNIKPVKLIFSWENDKKGIISKKIRFRISKIYVKIYNI